MHTTRLKKVGGSVMLTVPPALLNALSLGTDNEVGMVIDNGRLIVEPHKRPRYSLAELLAQCDPNAEISAEEREWLDSPAAGREEDLTWKEGKSGLSRLTLLQAMSNRNAAGTDCHADCL